MKVCAFLYRLKYKNTEKLGICKVYAGQSCSKEVLPRGALVSLSIPISGGVRGA